MFCSIIIFIKSCLPVDRLYTTKTCRVQWVLTGSIQIFKQRKPDHRDCGWNLKVCKQDHRFQRKPISPIKSCIYPSVLLVDAEIIDINYMYIASSRYSQLEHVFYCCLLTKQLQYRLLVQTMIFHQIRYCIVFSMMKSIHFYCCYFKIEVNKAIIIQLFTITLILHTTCILQEIKLPVIFKLFCLIRNFVTIGMRGQHSVAK